MSEGVVNRFTVSNDIVMWNQKRVCYITEIEDLVNDICGEGKDSRIVRIDRDIGKAIIRTMDKGLLCLAISGLKGNIQEAVTSYNVEDKNLSFIERVMKSCNVTEFETLFDKEMCYQDYYHFNIAKYAKLNVTVIKELTRKFKDSITRGMIIEACLLVKDGILDIDKINESFTLIGKEDVAVIVETILEKHDIKMKVSKRSDYAFKTEVQENMKASSLFPIFKAVQDLRKLKSSKGINEFTNILDSDINLKFLKIMNLFETSKSVNLIVGCYNTLIDELSKENNEDYSKLRVVAVNQKRYTNTFKSVVYSMKDIITRLKDKANIVEVEALVETVKDKI